MDVNDSTDNPPPALTDEDVAEGLAAIEATFARPDLNGCAIVDGYGAHVGVDRGELRLRDGLGPYRRQRRYPKVACPIERLVIVGEAAITTAALVWCAQAGVSVAVLDHDRDTLLTSTIGTDDARLRRQQAIAPTTGSGLAMAKLLLGAKLTGQAQIARTILDRPVVADTIESLAAALEVADDLEETRTLEAAAAAAYFSAWADNPAATLRFATKDRGRVPAHWLRFDGRRSLLGSAGSNRKAERPLKALLNFGYRLAEIEGRLATIGVGLDPGLGIVHMDKAGRDGMVLDVLEVARPTVEGIVLELAAGRTFRRSDFHQDAHGAVRVLAPLSHDLAAVSGRIRRELAPYAEKVAHLLAAGVETKIGRPTPLTGSARRAAQAKVKARKQIAQLATERGSEQAKRRPTAVTSARLGGCVDCGTPVSSLRRVRCDHCIEADPRQTPTLRANRARAISGRRQREAEWAKVNGGAAPIDPGWAAEVLIPALAGVTLRRVVEACSVTKSTASSWRNGKTTPHPMHWSILAELAGVPLPGRAPQGGAALGKKVAHG